MVGTQGALIAMPFYQDANSELTVRIENLTISSDGNLPAVFAYNVEAKNSTFIDNGASAIWALNSIEIENSSFINNSNDGFSFPNPDPNPLPDDPTAYEVPGWGGAVAAYGAVTISNSTFVGNTAFLGGAVYSEEYVNLNITNSTFIGNKVEGVGAEGGAIYAYQGEILFSTFVNNEAPGPEPDAEVPGNAIYKFGNGDLDLGANIFAGSSAFPQLGIGRAELPFTDLGGNVFSTARLAEFDNFSSTGAYGVTDGIHSSSVFGASLVALFGTNTPAVATHQPNTSGTQAIGLVETSPARNIVPAGEPFDSVLLDQRGASRTGQVADAGAFEGFVVPTTSPTLAKTGSDAPWWLTVSSVALLALGGLLSALSAKRSRRTL